MMITGETLNQLLDILNQIDGYVVVRWKGQEFVITRRQSASPGKQLALPTTSSLAKAVRKKARDEGETPASILDGINREIARYSVEEQEKEIDDLSLAFDNDHKQGKKIRFEPINGDLSPDLQE